MVRTCSLTYGALETADGKKEDEAKVSGAVADKKNPENNTAENLAID
jgi:hypothetical protein